MTTLVYKHNARPAADETYASPERKANERIPRGAATNTAEQCTHSELGSQPSGQRRLAEYDRGRRDRGGPWFPKRLLPLILATPPILSYFHADGNDHIRNILF